MKSASVSRRAKRIKIAKFEELDLIVSLVPWRYKLMILLAAWNQMRFGEISELRRGDIDFVDGLIRVERAVTHGKEEPRCDIGDPKTEAGIRDIAIPEHIMPVAHEYLAKHVGPGRNDLLFVPVKNGCHVRASSMHAVFDRARLVANRADLRFHDLRHTGATWYAREGATTKELMTRLGHTKPEMAMHYQHIVENRDRELADKMSKRLSSRSEGPSVERPELGAA
jgi:integrase